MKEIILGTKAQATTIVSFVATAKAVKSGSLPVFGTPMMIALMEEATCNCVSNFLEQGETTVGTHINISHDAPTVQGRSVTATAELTAADRKKLVFSVYASDDAGVIGKGTIERFVVNSELFMDKAEKR